MLNELIKNVLYIIMVLINILTRTGKREKYFKTLKDSIDAQTYKNIRHIKSNDNPNCKYLDDETDVFQVVPDYSSGNTFYNLYLNDLGEQLKEGWVIILDDDSKMIEPTFLEKLSEICENSNENDVIIYKSKLAKGTILPKDKYFRHIFFERAAIDMSNFCVHYSAFSKFKFKGLNCGDFWFLDSIKKSKEYNFKFVDLPLGIWANYDGCKKGR